MNKIKRWFYKEQFVDDGIMGSYRKVPTKLLEFIEALVGFILVIAFGYILLIVAAVW